MSNVKNESIPLNLSAAVMADLRAVSGIKTELDLSEFIRNAIDDRLEAERSKSERKDTSDLPLSFDNAYVLLLEKKVKRLEKKIRELRNTVTFDFDDDYTRQTPPKKA